MTYTDLTTDQTAAGQAVKQELVRLIKTNLTDHEARLVVLESTTSNYIPITFDVTGEYWRATMPQTGVLSFLVPFGITLTGAKIFLTTVGTAGTLDCDILYKRGGGAYTSIFSTRPSIAFGAGDNAVSSNAVLSTTALLTDDRLRLDIITSQTTTTATVPGNFYVILSFTKT